MLVGHHGTTARPVAPQTKKRPSPTPSPKRKDPSVARKQPLALPAKPGPAVTDNESAPQKNSTKAEEVIPFDDDEFEDF